MSIMNQIKERLTAVAQSRLAVAYILTVCSCGAAGYSISDPSERRFVGEDGIVEWLSATLFAIPIGLSAIAYRGRSITAWDARLLGVVSVLSLACLLSELSFGARIGGFSMPAMKGGGELDGGQDLLMILKRQIGSSIDNYRYYFAAIVSGVFAIVATLIILFRHKIKDALQSIDYNFQYAFFQAALSLLSMAVLFDLYETSATMAFEEILELAAAACLSLSVLEILGNRPAKQAQ